MRDAMVALARRGVKSAALVHRHTLSLKTCDETFTADKHHFQIVRTGLWARLLFTPISPAFPWHLQRLITTFKPNILHLHLPNPSVFWLLALPSARRIPWVVHWHADVITSTQGWTMKLFYNLYRPFEQMILKHAKAIVATSSPYLDSSRPLKKWIYKSHVVPLGVDVDRFNGSTSVYDKPTPNDNKLQVLAVGRLTYYKGFRYLIEAIFQTPGVHLNLVGDGDQAAQLKALVASLSLQDRVTFHGSLNNAELSLQMMACDCLCLSSITRAEAFGMVLLEAMYFGKATVISDVPGSGMGWIVDDGITGIKVKPADTSALAAALKQLNADRDKMKRMGQHGKDKFDQQFEINHAILGLMDIYDNTN